MKTPYISVIFAILCVGTLPAQQASVSNAKNGNDSEVVSLDENLPSVEENDAPSVPPRLLDDSHMNEELGINEFTAPSIKKIFENLEGLPPIPDSSAVRPRPERLPMDRCSLALQMGCLMADGFVVVQCAKMNEVKPIA